LYKVGYPELAVETKRGSLQQITSKYVSLNNASGGSSDGALTERSSSGNIDYKNSSSIGADEQHDSEEASVLQSTASNAKQRH